MRTVLSILMLTALTTAVPAAKTSVATTADTKVCSASAHCAGTCTSKVCAAGSTLCPSGSCRAHSAETSR